MVGNNAHLAATRARTAINRQFAAEIDETFVRPSGVGGDALPGNSCVIRAFNMAGLCRRNLHVVGAGDDRRQPSSLTRAARYVRFVAGPPAFALRVRMAHRAKQCFFSFAVLEI